MQIMAKRYPTEQRVRATRMAVDRLDEYGSAWGVAQALGPKLGVGPETLRKWVLQAQVDAGGRPGPSSEELAQIKVLKKENADLREANEILKAASIFFARVRAGDLLNRDFATTAPNRAWVTDFTYVPTWSGFAYVAFAIDLYPRAIVGCSAATTKDVAFVESCLSMALWRRDHTGRPVPAGMIHHSDYAEPCVKPRSRGFACAGGVR